MSSRSDLIKQAMAIFVEDVDAENSIEIYQQSRTFFLDAFAIKGPSKRELEKYEQLLAEIACDLEAKEKFAEAVAIHDELISLTNERSELSSRLQDVARIYMASTQFIEAADTYQKLIEVDSAEPQWPIRQRVALTAAGVNALPDISAAVDVLSKPVPSKGTVLVSVAQFALAHHDFFTAGCLFNEAISVWKGVIQTKDEFELNWNKYLAVAQYSYGDVVKHQGRYADALDAYEHGLATFRNVCTHKPDQLRYLRVLLQRVESAARELDDFDRCDEVLTECLKITDDLALLDPIAKTAYGVLCVDRQDLVQAKRYFGEALSEARKLSAPVSTYYLMKWGEILELTGDLEGAEQAYTEKLEINLRNGNNDSEMERLISLVSGHGCLGNVLIHRDVEAGMTHINTAIDVGTQLVSTYPKSDAAKYWLSLALSFHAAATNDEATWHEAEQMLLAIQAGKPLSRLQRGLLEKIQHRTQK